MNVFRVVVIGLMLCTVLAIGVSRGRRADKPGDRERADKLFIQGNYKDAYEAYRALALDPTTEPGRVGTDLGRAVQSLEHLGRVDEVDAFREAVVTVHQANWRLLQAAAESCLNDSQHAGFLIAGKFHRGQHHATGQYVSSYERDRSRALQLLVDGLDRAKADPDRGAAAGYLLTLAQALMGNRAVEDSWRLQVLTPLDKSADYDNDPYAHWGGQQAGGAPVEPDGTPVFYRVPESFEKAKNDGERWRWALTQTVEANPGLLNTIRLEMAGFVLSQFGTQTIAGSPFAGGPVEGRPEASGPYALDTLQDDETIARLATGIKRFKLPDEFNPIKIYQTVAGDPKTGKDEEALNGLATIFENRRQFDRAVVFLERSRVLHGNGNDGWKKKQIDQILEAWGQFEPQMTQPAGRGATVDFRFRNGRRVHFEAHEVLFGKLLQDVKDYVSSSPNQIDWQKSDISDVGSRLVAMNQQQYLGRSVAQWNLDLEPLAGHLDRRVSVTTPLQKAGAYFAGHLRGWKVAIPAGSSSGSTTPSSSRSRLVGQTYYFVADARTGQPVPRADVELFGWRMVQVNGKNEFHVETKTLAQKTDDNGQVQVATAGLSGPQVNYQWLITARTTEGRFAHLGFVNIWEFPGQPSAHDEIKVYTITDRPVYRPGTPVRFKFWVARTRYDQPEASEFAGKTFAVEIRNPKGDKVFTKECTSDAFGGYDGSFELPSDAMLGAYQVFTPNRGGGSSGRRRIQETGVRGERRCSDRAGDAR